LARENQDTLVSVANLHLLHDEGLQVLNLIAGTAGLLFIFHTGEQYLATGLRVGNHQSVESLAELMAEWAFGDRRELSALYAALPDDYRGPIPLGQV